MMDQKAFHDAAQQTISVAKKYLPADKPLGVNDLDAVYPFWVSRGMPRRVWKQVVSSHVISQKQATRRHVLRP
jgi:hypothetical protein